jgi:hypothetical protein
MILVLFFICLLSTCQRIVESSLQNDNKLISREDSLKEEIELFHKSFSSSTSSTSVFPFLVNLSVSHKFFPRPYSFNEWEWLSFPRLLIASKSLCQQDTTFYSSWTLPIKCEYYLIIRALRFAKDKESELNEKERKLIQSYVDEIYGKKEEYDKIKEKLKAPFLSKEENEELFHLTTILESNGLVDLVINNNDNHGNNHGGNEISQLIEEKRILEKCSFQQLSMDSSTSSATSSSSFDSTSTVSSFSIGFFFILQESHFIEYYHQKKKISEMSFFQNFVKSFLQFYQKYSMKLEEQRKQGYQQTTENQFPPIEFLFSLFISYDSDLHSSYLLSASTSSSSTTTNSNLIEDFTYALKYFFPFFQRIFLQGYENMKEIVYNPTNQETYHFQSVVLRKEEMFYNFPFLYKELLKESLFLSSSSTSSTSSSTSQQSTKAVDYYCFLQDSFSLSSDFTFFHSLLSPLIFTNPFFPNFGVLLSFQKKERNDYLILPSSYFEMMKGFPLSIHVLNNSYLNEKQSRFSSIEEKGRPEMIDYSWNAMYFTFLDIFSVFQPFLFQKNVFLEENAINYTLLTTSSSPSSSSTKERTEVNNNVWISKGFQENIHRYKVFIERNRRHISKWLSHNDLYLSYHTCINEEMNSLIMEEENKDDMMVESTVDGSNRMEKKEEDKDEKEGNEDFSHPVQFFWRPNQLLYEINGIFSEINF